jgi:hypothetical protein
VNGTWAQVGQGLGSFLGGIGASGSHGAPGGASTFCVSHPPASFEGREESEAAMQVQEALRYRLTRLVRRSAFPPLATCRAKGGPAAGARQSCKASVLATAFTALLQSSAQVTGDAWDARPQLKMRVLKLMVGGCRLPLGTAVSPTSPMLMWTIAFPPPSPPSAPVPLHGARERAHPGWQPRASGGVPAAPHVAAKQVGRRQAALHGPCLPASRHAEHAGVPTIACLVATPASAASASALRRRAWCQPRSAAGARPSTRWLACRAHACCPCSSWPCWRTWSWRRRQRPSRQTRQQQRDRGLAAAWKPPRRCPSQPPAFRPLRQPPRSPPLLRPRAQEAPAAGMAPERSSSSVGAAPMLPPTPAQGGKLREGPHRPPPPPPQAPGTTQPTASSIDDLLGLFDAPPAQLQPATPAKLQTPLLPAVPASGGGAHTAQGFAVSSWWRGCKR